MRCLFRVAFVPRDACDLAQEDLTAFEYLYLQVVANYSSFRDRYGRTCDVRMYAATIAQINVDLVL